MFVFCASDPAARRQPPPRGRVRPQEARPEKKRLSRPASEITREELAACFHLPSEAACRQLNIGLTVLKRQCRRFGIKRWPFRKMKSLDRLINNVQQGVSPGDQNRALIKSVEELEAQKRKMARAAPRPPARAPAVACPAAVLPHGVLYPVD